MAHKSAFQQLPSCLGFFPSLPITNPNRRGGHSKGFVSQLRQAWWHFCIELDVQMFFCFVEMC